MIYGENPGHSPTTPVLAAYGISGFGRVYYVNYAEDYQWNYKTSQNPEKRRLQEIISCGGFFISLPQYQGYNRKLEFDRDGEILGIHTQPAI